MYRIVKLSCSLVKSAPTLKKNRDCYYQIQGALYIITGRPRCDLFIWIPIGTCVKWLHYDPTVRNKAYV